MIKVGQQNSSNKNTTRKRKFRKSPNSHRKPNINRQRTLIREDSINRKGKFRPKAKVTLNQVETAYDEIAPWPKITLPRTSRLTEYHQLSWYDTIDLRQYYNISWLYSIQRTWPFIIFWYASYKNIKTIRWGVLKLAESLGDYVDLSFLQESNEILNYAVYGIIAVVAVQILALIAYNEIYRRMLTIVIDGLRFKVTHGVFKRRSIIIAMRAHHVIWLQQKTLDVPFGLYRLTVAGSGVGAADEENVTIPGLSRRDSFDLFKFFHTGLSQMYTIKDTDTDNIYDEV